MVVRRFLMVLLSLGVVLAFIAPPASARGASVGQPEQTVAGMDYGQWSAAWWKWAANISEPHSPVTDSTGEDCAVRQQGPVWFLAGTTGTEATRSCTVPAGKRILIPIINGECSQVEGNGSTEAELRACAVGQMDHVTEIAASVDGVPVNLGPASDSKFRFQSPAFKIKFAPNNGFYPGPDGISGSGKAVADGYWLPIRPLRVGTHTIDVEGTAVFPEYDDFVYHVDVHYDITIAPPHKHAGHR